MVRRIEIRRIEKEPIRHIRRALNKKRRLWRSYRSNKSLLYKRNYKEQDAFVRKLIYDHNKRIELSVINRVNTGTFYHFVNGKLSCKSGVGPLKTPPGEMIVDDVGKAELLSNYFASVLQLIMAICQSSVVGLTMTFVSTISFFLQLI